MLWDWAYAFKILPLLLQASIVTLQVTILSFAAAVVGGLLLAVLRMSQNVVVYLPVSGLIEVVRSTPLLMQIFAFYYVLPSFGIRIGALEVGVLALGLHYATYCSEAFRAGIQSIPRGQWDAIIALNISRFSAFSRIIVPQVIPRVMPILGNYLIALFKETPLLSIIALVELVSQAKLLAAESFRYIEPMTLVGVFFLVLSLAASGAIKLAETWLDSRGYRP